MRDFSHHWAILSDYCTPFRQFMSGVLHGSFVNAKSRVLGGLLPSRAGDGSPSASDQECDGSARPLEAIARDRRQAMTVSFDIHMHGPLPRRIPVGSAEAMRSADRLGPK